MFRKFASSLIFLSCPLAFLVETDLAAHCQMPCGIYHDDMVYDQIDQYCETMYKCIFVLNENKFETPRDRNEFVRWVMEKESSSDEIAHIITNYFMQQKMKPGDDGLGKKVEAAQKMLFLLVKIKQTVDIEIVKEFMEEWGKFKLFFHQDGYECQMEALKAKKVAAEKAAAEKEAHEKTDHAKGPAEPAKK